MKFKPKIAIGSGGYVSGPAIFGAYILGAKIILLEQNSYPGITTRLLERYADEIHLSFEDTKKYLKQTKKIFVSGNPVRSNISVQEKKNALTYFSLKNQMITIFVFGGSLGAATINEALANSINILEQKQIQVIWQTGKLNYNKCKKYESELVKIFPFIEKMEYAYCSADLVIARAGATTLAELTLLGKPSILIPSPNVAANHQYYNAKTLFDKGAALLLKDEEAKNKLFETINSIIFDQAKLERMSQNAYSLAKPEASKNIAKSIIKIGQIV